MQIYDPNINIIDINAWRNLTLGNGDTDNKFASMVSLTYKSIVATTIRSYKFYNLYPKG